jgi:hypothetical protein
MHDAYTKHRPRCTVQPEPDLGLTDSATILENNAGVDGNSGV